MTLQVQLLLDREQVQKLSATIAAFSEAANWLAGEAFKLKTANKVILQQLYYAQLRERFGLSAQMAVRCIAQVCEAYSRDRRIKPSFRKYASVPYDQRLMSFKGLDKVSLLTLEGRINVPLIMGRYQAERFHHKHGQYDLVRRKDGKWFLLVTVEVPEGAPTPTTDFIGVDFGVVNIATDSDGEIHTNDETEKVRQHYRKTRRSLQKKAAKRKKSGERPKNIKRKLKELSGRERRFKANENHRISKRLVEKATDTNRGIGLEDLTGIRDRTRFRKAQRDQMSKWAFAELRGFIEYKAKFAGVPVQPVDPRDISKTCPCCGHIDRGNRLVRGIFLCRNCGYFDHADVVGAKNIASAARVAAREVAEKQLEEERVA
jgi:putative transposase